MHHLLTKPSPQVATTLVTTSQHSLQLKVKSLIVKLTGMGVRSQWLTMQNGAVFLTTGFLLFGCNLTIITLSSMKVRKHLAYGENGERRYLRNDKQEELSY